MLKGKKFVSPGDFIASEEELVESAGTFTDFNGNVYTTKPGFLEMDLKERTAKVAGGPKDVFRAARGAVVQGRITSMTQSIAVLSLAAGETLSERQFLQETTGIIPVALASQGFVKSLRDVFRVGDIVKAKIFATEPGGFKLSAKDPGMGVQLAWCSKCRGQLRQLKNKKLRCDNCNFVEERRIASDYALTEH